MGKETIRYGKSVYGIIEFDYFRGIQIWQYDEINAHQAKNMGPIWAPDGKINGSYMGNPYGTDMGFAAGIYLGPIWAYK